MVPLVALLVADPAQRVLGQAAGEPLLEHAAVARDAHQQPLGERVHDGDADAVQAAGDLVAVAAELAAGVQLRHHDLDRGQAGALDDADRDAGAVVDDGHRAVAVQRHRDGVAAPREGLVDAVVEHLPDEVMQAPHAGRADVHAGTAPDRLETFEDRDVLCAVLGICQSPPLPRVARRGPARHRIGPPDACPGMVAKYPASDRREPASLRGIRQIAGPHERTLQRRFDRGPQRDRPQPVPQGARRPPRRPAAGAARRPARRGCGTGPTRNRRGGAGPASAAASFSRSELRQHLQLARPAATR